MWQVLFVYLSLAEQAVNLILHLAGVFLLVDVSVLLPIAFVAVAYQKAVADATRALLAHRADGRWPEPCLDFGSLAHLLCPATLVIAGVAKLVVCNGALLAFWAQLAFVTLVVFRMRFPTGPVDFPVARFAVATILTRFGPLAAS